MQCKTQCESLKVNNYIASNFPTPNEHIKGIRDLNETVSTTLGSHLFYAAVEIPSTGVKTCMKRRLHLPALFSVSFQAIKKTTLKTDEERREGTAEKNSYAL